MKKTCKVCGIEKDLSKFNVAKSNKDGKKGICRDCDNKRGREYFHDHKEEYRDYRRKQRHKRQKLVQSYKAVPCMDCGVEYPYYVMDFDHRNPEEKEFLIAAAGYGMTTNGKNRGLKGGGGVSEERLLKEMQKCDVVCSNCHRERTHQRRLAKNAENLR